MRADKMKPIRMSGHALGYVVRRGFSVSEVEETIRASVWEPAELGRLQCQKDFAFGKQWNNVFYGTKRVRPIFVEEPHEIVVVTVYTFYFLKEDRRMRIAYDANVDALSIVFREGTVTTKELGEGIALEYAVDGRLAGVEILDAVKRFGDAGTLRQIILEGGRA